jgi:hypothetical protein
MRDAFTVIVLALSLGLSEGASAAPDPACGVPRIGWSLKPPKDGEIRELYWGIANYSELWMTLRPQQATLASKQTGVPELLLVFSICFPGKVMPPQREAELRVEVNRNFIPAPAPDPRLGITINADGSYDLTGPDFRHSTEYLNGCSAGDLCVYTAELVDLPITILQRMATARTVTGAISGTPFALTEDQLQELGAFVKRITGR